MHGASASRANTAKTVAHLSDDPPRWLPFAVLALATALAFASAIPGGLVWIDHVEIIEGGYRVESAHDFGRLWYLTLDEFLERRHEAHRAVGGYWRPLYALSISLDWLLWKDRAWCYHVENVGWHLIVVLELYALGLFLTRSSPYSTQTAFWAALLFAVHPLGVHSVTWISGRKDTMCAAFALAALLAFARIVSRDDDRPSVRVWPWLLVACGCTMAALLCKELAAVVPLAATLIIWPISPLNKTLFRTKCATAGLSSSVFRENRGTAGQASSGTRLFQRAATLRPGGAQLSRFRRNLLALGSLWFVVAAWAVYRVTVLSGLGLNARYPSGRWADNLATSATLWWHYVGRELVPVNPSISDAWPIAHGYGAVETAAVTMLFASAALIVFGIWRRWPIVPGLLWYVVWMLPAAGFVPLRHFRAERYLYPATWGLMFALVTLIVQATTTPTRRTIPIGTSILFSVIAGWFLVTTAVENRHWRDDATLFEHSLDLDPRHVEARLGLAHLALEQKDYQKAIDQSRRAIQIAGDSSHTAYWSPFLAYTNLGLAHYYQGDYSAAREAFDVALAHRPEHATAHYHAGLAAFAVGDLQSAKVHYLAALKRNPDDFLTRSNLGATWLHLRNPQRCIETLRPVIAERPDDATNLANFASAMLVLGDFAGALPHFERLAALDPKQPAHRAKLAWCQWETGRRTEAVQTIEQTLRQAPLDPTTRNIARMMGIAPSGGP